MRKLQIVLAILALSAIIFAAGPGSAGDVKQPIMPQRPIGGRSGPVSELPLVFSKSFYGFENGYGFIRWIFMNLPDVELKSQVKGVEVLSGEVFITVEASNEEYKIYIPAVMVKVSRLTVRQGDKIAVKGKKLVLKKGVMLIPEKFVINGKEYNMKSLMQKFERFWISKENFMLNKPGAPVKPPIKAPKKP